MVAEIASSPSIINPTILTVQPNPKDLYLDILFSAFGKITASKDDTEMVIPTAVPRLL